MDYGTAQDDKNMYERSEVRLSDMAGATRPIGPQTPAATGTSSLGRAAGDILTKR